MRYKILVHGIFWRGVRLYGLASFPFSGSVHSLRCKMI